MIGGVSGGYPVLVPVDRSGDRRERQLQIPAQEAFRREDQAGDVHQNRPQHPGLQNLVETGLEREAGSVLQQRVEARLQAQVVRLERDGSPVLSRQNQQALQTYGSVASTRDDLDVELVGLDLRV